MTYDREYINSMGLRKNDKLQTPPWIIRELGDVDLDPCAGVNTHIGKTNWAIERGENGLLLDWYGLVFCNPPFSQKEQWIKKMIAHGLASYYSQSGALHHGSDLLLRQQVRIG